MNEINLDQSVKRQYLAFLISLLFHLLFLIIIIKISFEIKMDHLSESYLNQTNVSFQSKQSKSSQTSLYQPNQPQEESDDYEEENQTTQNPVIQNNLNEKTEEYQENENEYEYSEPVKEIEKTNEESSIEEFYEKKIDLIKEKEEKKPLKKKKKSKYIHQKAAMLASAFVNAFRQSYKTEQTQFISQNYQNNEQTHVKQHIDELQLYNYIERINKASVNALYFTPGTHLFSEKGLEKELTVVLFISKDGKLIEKTFEPKIEMIEVEQIINRWLNNIDFPPIPNNLGCNVFRHQFRIKVSVKEGSGFYELRLSG